ncbi:MAG: four helix bundle protein [Myxococcales bacterium]|nr:MAG: four helix bundle protein [Myxococcales bacterium]
MHDSHDDNRLPIQRLEVYALAKDFARMVHEAGIKDRELRDQATRASKSVFLHLCEGLPNKGTAMRRKYFTGAQNSLNETVGAIDLAEAIGSTSPEHSQELQSLALRLHQIIAALMRK